MKNIFLDRFIKNKYFFYFSLLILGMTILFFPALSAKAMDETAPQISNLRVDKDVAEPGDVIKISFDVVEDETGIVYIGGGLIFNKAVRYVDYTYASVKGNIAINYKCRVGDNRPNIYTGTCTLEIPITESTAPGVYTYGNLYYHDDNGNSANYEVEEGFRLTIVNPDYAKNHIAKVLDFSILNDTINSSDQVPIDITFEGHDLDLSTNKVNSLFSFYFLANNSTICCSKGSEFTTSIDENGNTVVHVECRFSDNINLKAQKYILQNVIIRFCNYEDRYYYYDSDDENGYIFKDKTSGDTCLCKGSESITFLDYVEDTSETVEDKEKPVIQNVKILNKKVNRPDVLRFSYEASDNCGLRGARFEAYRKEDGTRVNCNGFSLEGKLTVSDTSYINIYDNATPGTYILYAQVTDLSGNTSDLIKIEFEVVDEYVEGYDVAFDIGINNPDLIEDFQNLEDGKTGLIRAEWDNTAYIPKAAFEAIQGRDVYLIAQYSYYIWVFYGKDITDPKDVWVGLTVSRTRFYYYDNPTTTEEQNDYEDVLRLTFPDNGILPGKMQLRFKSDYLYNMYNLTQTYYVYFEDSTDQSLTYMENAHPEYVVNGEEHWCYFDIYHHSRYLLGGRELKKKNSSSRTNSAGTNTSSQTSNSGSTNNSATVQFPDRVAKITSKKINGKMYISWGNSNNAVGYEVEWSTSKTFKGKISRKRFTSAKGRHYLNIKKGKVYYVRIRSYSYYNNRRGVYLYSAYSPVKKIKR